MRRATWLATGAVLGVLGYRRLDRAAKSLTGNFGPVLAGRQHRVKPRTGRPCGLSLGIRFAGLGG